MTPTLLSSGSLTGTEVFNGDNENIGTITDLMIDIGHGQIAYAVLSFGGILGIGDKLFAVPWKALSIDTVEERFILNVNKETLDQSEGFDKDNWPDWSNLAWNENTHKLYDVKPYWEN